MKFRHLLVFLSFMTLISQSYAVEPVPSPPAESQPLAYGPGERLEYKVSYFGLPAGKAVMEVLEKTEMKGREVFHVLSTVKSNDAVSFFYPVKDRVETFIDVKGRYSHAIKIKQRQGKKKRDKVIDFDQTRHRAIQYKNNKVETFLVPPKVQDSLSAIYYFRSRHRFEVGQSIFIDVHESRKNWELEIKVLGRETLKTALGTFKTVKVKAIVRYEGLFMDKGDVTLWLTDDYRHIPVLIKTKIKIGHILAEISEKGSHLSLPDQT